MLLHPVLEPDSGDCRTTDDFELLAGDGVPYSQSLLLPQIPKFTPQLAKKKILPTKEEFTGRNDSAFSDVLCLGNDHIYDPYQDYFGLCQEFAGGRAELSPSSDISLSSDESSDSFKYLSFQASNPPLVNSNFIKLDQERLRALTTAEFERNGTTYELDEYDIIQQKVRGHGPPTREIPVVPNDRIKEYLWLKQCKTARGDVTQLQVQGKKKSKLICVFCKNNKEPPHVYTGHVLKDSRGYTACPVLRKYPCPICQAIGDHAHTIKYCPFNNDSEFRTSPSPLRTTRMATGKKRRT
uniref:Nanos-like protein n=1 Tax=Haliotis asinina TaxID=109174 RepID=C7EAA0_HALAI|nr:nanos-like protein [Haliotis asinina]